MRIKDLRSEKKAGRSRIAATVIWEDCDRSTHDVYFETEEAFAEGLVCNPHAFLVGCTIPALHYGEQRVFIDAEICPELKLGLTEAMSWLRHWYYRPDRALVRIEARTRSGLPTPRTPERAGFFFSGGIDSYATLRTNHLNFPPEHPWSIKNGVLVFGLEIEQPGAFEYVLDSLTGVAPQIGISLIPVYTNLYLNYRSEDAQEGFRFWLQEFQGAAFAALAHAFAGRFTAFSIASSHDVRDLVPYGTHPLLDPYYSSSDLRIRQDGIALTRLDKTKLVAEWDVALQHIRVCNMYTRYQPGMLNCGRCEKCLRTMLALVALGKLDQTRSFPSQDVSAKMIMSELYINNDVAPFYRDLIQPLEMVGRSDLTHAIRSKLAEFKDPPRPVIRKRKFRKLIKHLGVARIKSSAKNRFNTGKDIKRGAA